MRHWNVVTAFLIVVTLIASTGMSAWVAAEVPNPVGDDTIVARIGGTVYTLADIRQRMAYLPAPYRYAAERRLPEYVQEIVRRELLAREARRVGIDHELAVRAELEEAVQAVLIRALLKEVTAQAMPTPDEVRAYYDGHPEEFRVPEQLEVDEVVVNGEAQADAIRGAVRAGQLFEEAVTAVNGDKPARAIFARGKRDPAIEQVAFALAVHEVSPPVRSREGILLLHLRARHPARVQPIEAATPAIQARLAREKQQRLWKGLQDRLWDAEGVVVHDDLLRAAARPPAAPDSQHEAAGPEVSGRSTTPAPSDTSDTPKTKENR
jgi:peptidyl-prolyl cis-trans isomerase C